MPTPIFLSIARPQHPAQERFLRLITDVLEARGLAPYTIGVTEACTGPPLPAIRRLMREVHGLAVVAFRRTWITETASWRTSLFCQIEMAMAYQRGLPILVARERGVTAEGMFETMPECWHLPEFDLDQDAGRLPQCAAWEAALAGWCARLPAGTDPLR